MTTGEEGFLNPYTFIPAFPRDALPEPFLDAAPPSRDRLRAECLTGVIAVTLTVETPLLLLDTTRPVPPSTEEKDHLVYPVRLRDGRPHLPATTVKGMLRAAYEAATNSRFGVFDNHDTPMDFRRAPGLKPVRFEGDGAFTYLKSALLEMYDESGRRLYPNEKRHAPRHLERLKALVKDGGKHGRRVGDFVPANSPERLTPQNEEQVVTGVVHIVESAGRRRYGRFFYEEKPERKKLSKWQWQLLASKWDSQARERVRTPGEEPERLRPGTIYLAEIGKGGITALHPVMTPLYPVAPAKLLGEDLTPAPRYECLSPADRVFGWVAPKGSGARPAAYRGRLRVGPVTCDGTAADAVVRFEGDGLPLTILSRPKPQQGRFYLSESRQRPQRPIEDGTPEEELYAEGRGLRGRKVYWHHAGLDAGKHWNVAGPEDPAQAPAGDRHREYTRSWKSPGDSGELTRDRRRYETVPDAEQRDSQNRSINGWVRPGTVFRFTVEVRDLDEHELGALAWLLSLPEGHFHRLGLGRPLGFGSVRLAVDPDGTDLHTGAEYAAYYRTLTGDLPATDGAKVLEKARQVFEEKVASSPELSTIRDAMLTVSRGDPALPVHYPRTRPNGLLPGVPTPPDPRGRNFEWFTANEQSEESPKIRTQRSLPGLEGNASPLVIYPQKAKGKAANSTRRKGGNKR